MFPIKPIFVLQTTFKFLTYMELCKILFVP